MSPAELQYLAEVLATDDEDEVEGLTMTDVVRAVTQHGYARPQPTSTASSSHQGPVAPDAPHASVDMPQLMAYPIAASSCPPADTGAAPANNDTLLWSLLIRGPPVTPPGTGMQPLLYYFGNRIQTATVSKAPPPRMPLQHTVWQNCRCNRHPTCRGMCRRTCRCVRHSTCRCNRRRVGRSPSSRPCRSRVG